MAHASLSKFYNNVIRSNKPSKDFARRMELEPFPVRTRYNISFSFPMIKDVKTGTDINNSGTIIPQAQISALNELTNLLLQDIKFPALSYGGVSAGDAKMEDAKHGGLGGQFSTLNDADMMTASDPDVEMLFLNTKFSILERYFLPWIRHCTDTKSTKKYKVYPFIRGSLDVQIYNDNIGVEPTESDILYHYRFEDIYPYEITLTDIHCSAVDGRSDVRSVKFDYNNFKLIETYSTKAQMFDSLPDKTTRYYKPSFMNVDADARNNQIVIRPSIGGTDRQSSNASSQDYDNPPAPKTEAQRLNLNDVLNTALDVAKILI